MPEPSLDLGDRLDVGAGLMFHTIPFVVMLSPPSLVMDPPLVALFKVMLEAVVVVNCGAVFVGAEEFSLAQPNIVAITKKSGEFFFMIIRGQNVNNFLVCG